MCFVTNGLDYRRRPFYLKRLLFACHWILQGVTSSFDLQKAQLLRIIFQFLRQKFDFFCEKLTIPFND